MVGYSERLAFDDFLMFLDLAETSSISSALPPPLTPSTLSSSTAIITAVGVKFYR